MIRKSKNNKYLNILLFVISIPLGLLINYYITSELVSRLNYSSVYVYMVVALLQVIIIYEGLKLVFFKSNLFDKILIFTIYLIIVYIGLFFRPPLGIRIFNWNPFAFVLDIMIDPLNAILITVLNVLVFIPLPYLLKQFIKDKNKIMMLSLFIVVFVELLQVITTRGMFDFSDIFLYCIGIMIGSLFVRKVKD